MGQQRQNMRHMGRFLPVGKSQLYQVKYSLKATGMSSLTQALALKLTF